MLNLSSWKFEIETQSWTKVSSGHRGVAIFLEHPIYEHICSGELVILNFWQKQTDWSVQCRNTLISHSNSLPHSAYNIQLQKELTCLELCEWCENETDWIGVNHNHT